MRHHLFVNSIILNPNDFHLTWAAFSEEALEAQKKKKKKSNYKIICSTTTKNEIEYLILINTVQQRHQWMKFQREAESYICFTHTLYYGILFILLLMMNPWSRTLIHIGKVTQKRGLSYWHKCALHQFTQVDRLDLLHKQHL